MSDEVIFRAIDGALKDEEFVFEENGLCLIGRSGDCALQIPREKDMRISRRHCLLIINPPKIRIRDLGSRNGTFVNGEALPAGTLGDVPEQMTPHDRVLTHGDKVNIGETSFEVLIPSLKAAGTSVALPPPGTKIVKLAKPEKAFAMPSSNIKKSTPVESGFFIPPPVTKGVKHNTSTAPLTEVFSKPPPSMPSASPGDHSRRMPGEKVQSQPPAPGATLILKAKAAPAPSVAHPVSPPLQPPIQDAQPVAPPRKVLKGRIVKKGAPAPSVPPAPPAAPPVSPASPAQLGTEIMDNTNLPDDTKLGGNVQKKGIAKKRVTKFKIKTPKK